jgi:hypothetical protein
VAFPIAIYADCASGVYPAMRQVNIALGRIMKYVLIFTIILISLSGSYSLGYVRGEEVRKYIDDDKSVIEIAMWSRDWRMHGNRTDWDSERVQKTTVESLDFNKWHYKLHFFDSKSNKREAQFVKEYAAYLSDVNWKPYLEVFIIATDPMVLEKKELTKIFGSYSGRVNAKDGWAMIQTRAVKKDVMAISDPRIQKLIIISNYN